MIVRDEAQRLPTCLESVRHVVDEIVVVDTGSTDRTIAIARQFGAQVHSFTWCDDFSAARNASIRAAHGDWILVLDADEVLQTAIVPTLRQAIQSPDHLVVMLLRQEVGAQQAPYSLLSRLFRNHPDLSFSHPYHELIDDSVAALLQREPQWRIVELPGVAIRHTGYQAETIATRQKLDRARRLMERHLAAHPNNAYICNKLGTLYVESGAVVQGLDLLHRGLSLSQVESPILYELHYHLAGTYHQLQQFAAAERHFRAAVSQPISALLKLGAYNNWGNLCLERGDASTAKALYEQVIQIDPQSAIGHFNLAQALKATGDLTGAIAAYEQAIQLAPTYAEAYQNLGVALEATGNLLESLIAFRRAIALHDQQGSPEAERLRQGLRRQGFKV
jgi:tetratricopeptide (TPR) repeat protein